MAQVFNVFLIFQMLSYRISSHMVLNVNVISFGLVFHFIHSQLCNKCIFFMGIETIMQKNNTITRRDILLLKIIIMFMIITPKYGSKASAK